MLLDDVFDTLDQDRVEELSKLISKARNDYYNGQPNVSDDEYDSWVDELKSLEKSHKQVVGVGAPVSSVTGWLVVHHGFLMGSLEKVKSLEEITQWFVRLGVPREKSDFVVSEKLDGISIHAQYSKGKFVRAITRGDGLAGEDITKNVALMKGVVKNIDSGFTGSLRGEIIMRKEVFAKEGISSLYSNPRNAASGISRRYDSERCSELEVKFYDLMQSNSSFETLASKLEWLAIQGFSTPAYYLTSFQPGKVTPHDIWVRYHTTERANLAYDIDGLVVSINNVSFQNELGFVSNCPRYAVAFKFPPVVAETRVKRVDWRVGSTGVIIPVVEFDPVYVMGVCIKEATLHSASNFLKFKPKEGSRIKISRANDVIPYVVSVSNESSQENSSSEIIVDCPSCGTKLETKGAHSVCPNISGCPAQLQGRVQRYLEGIGVKGWGEVLISNLVAKGLVSSISDLYLLDVSRLVTLEGVGERKAQSLMSEFQDKARVMSLETLLSSLSIPDASEVTIKTILASGFDTWGKFSAISEVDLGKVRGVGEVRSKKIFSWLRNGGSVLVESLVGAGVILKEEKPQGDFVGLSFCFTGTMIRKRSVLEKSVVDKGGVVKGSVTKDLNFLVVADKTATSQKINSAKKNGTNILTEEEFVVMVSR